MPALLMTAACSKDHGQDGTAGRIRLSFPDEMYKAALEHFELPDTNDFILDIRNSAGKSVYSGYYGDSPEAISVPAGSYTVKVKASDGVRESAEIESAAVIITVDGSAIIPQTGDGSDMIRPMAIAIIGGLVYGTILTLIVIPCIYDAFNREKSMVEEEL